MPIRVDVGKLVRVRTEQVLDGRYQLEDRLGAGGMSVVWRAHDQVLDRSVAVKLLAGRHATSPGARERIRLEAQAAARLWHPNVTNVYDYGESTGDDGELVPYVVMELLPGRTLAQRLSDGPLPPRAALRILSEVAAALAAAHTHGLVHRDVKPSNVMLTPSGAKVVDFGIAAVVGRSELEADGELLGTPAYLAPERLTGGEVSPASDVYALGLLVYRALTNRLPWLAETTTQMLNAHVYMEPEPLPAIDGVPASVNAVCDRCLAKDPADRPPAAEVAAALAEAAGIVPPPEDDAPAAGWAPMPAPTTDAVAKGTTEGIRRRGSRRRRLAAVAAGLVVIAAVAALAFLLPRDREAGSGVAAPGASNPAGAAAATASSTPAPQISVAAGEIVGPTLRPGSAATPAGLTPGPGAGAGGASPTGGPVPGGGGGGSGPEATPGPVAPGPSVPIVTLGGIVTVRCVGTKIEVVGISLGLGFLLDKAERGPAKNVKATLLSLLHKTEVTAHCDKGNVVKNVKESAR